MTLDLASTSSQEWRFLSFLENMASFISSLRSSRLILHVSPAVWRKKVHPIQVAVSENAQGNKQESRLQITEISNFQSLRESEFSRKESGYAMVEIFRRKIYGGSKYDSKYICSDSGEALFTQTWIPTDEMKAVVVLLHGLNEHSGRYEEFAQVLNKSGFGVFCMDWTGHGCSDGLHGYVHSLDQVVADVKQFICSISAEFPRLPFFLFGHSTGGSICLKTAMSLSAGFPLAGVILTSPALLIEVPNRALALLAPIASLLIPKFGISSAGRPTAKISRDPLVIEAKYGDPLVYTGPIRARTGWEVLKLASSLQRDMESITVPFFVLHGTDDKVTEPNGSRMLYEKAASDYKEIRLYEGLLHDLLFEPEKGEIADDILEWMRIRLEQVQE